MVDDPDAKVRSPWMRAIAPLLFAFALDGCGPLASPPLPSPTTTHPISVAAGPPSSLATGVRVDQTPSPSEATKLPEAAAAPTLGATTSAPHTHLASFIMANPSNGWGIADVPGGQPPGTGDDTQEIWRTSDGGAHWANDTPADATKQRGGFYARDALHAWWVVSARTPGNVRILRTVDGAASWQSSMLQLPQGMTDAGPYFLDTQQGWLITSHSPGMMTVPSDLFASSDGGVTWQLAGHLPFAGGLDFVSPTVGWLAGSQSTTGQGELYKTADGGRSWKPVVLPQPPANGAPDDGRDVKSPPTFFSANKQDGYLRANNYFIDVTSDGGKSWSVRALPSPSGASAGDVTFADAKHGWWWSSERASQTAFRGFLYRTIDGGATWSSVALPTNVAALFDSGWEFSHMQFLTSQLGWGLMMRDSASQLLQTTDGGMSWRLVYS